MLLKLIAAPFATTARRGRRFIELGLMRVLAFAGIAVLSVAVAQAQTKLDPKEPGTSEIKVACGGHDGAISGRTGVGFFGGENHYTGGISITYKGTKCDECHLIQFFWRALYWSDAKGNRTAIPGGGAGTGGKAELTTDPDKPVWKVDTGGTTPYYDDADSTYIRDSNSLTELDAPSADGPLEGLKKTRTKFPKATSFQYEAHYEAFLVCAGKVCAKATWIVTQDYSDLAAPAPQPPSRAFTSIESPAKNPDAAQMKALGDIPEVGGQPWIK